MKGEIHIHTQLYIHTHTHTHTHLIHHMDAHPALHRVVAQLLVIVIDRADLCVCVCVCVYVWMSVRIHG
jgi:hypothetical protein